MNGYTNTGDLCLPRTIPVRSFDRSASNSRVSTAAVEACYIIRYKLCERNKLEVEPLLALF